MLRCETVVLRRGVGPRHLHLDGDGGAGGGRGDLPRASLSGPGDHLVKTVGSARVRAELEIISCSIRSGSGLVEGRHLSVSYWKCNLNEFKPRTR